MAISWPCTVFLEMGVLGTWSLSTTPRCIGNLSARANGQAKVWRRHLFALYDGIITPQDGILNSIFETKLSSVSSFEA